MSDLEQPQPNLDNNQNINPEQPSVQGSPEVPPVQPPSKSFLSPLVIGLLIVAVIGGGIGVYLLLSLNFTDIPDDEPEEPNATTTPGGGGGDGDNGDPITEAFDYECNDLISIAKIEQITGVSGLIYEPQKMDNGLVCVYKLSNPLTEEGLKITSGIINVSCSPNPDVAFESMTSRNKDMIKSLNLEAIEETTEIGRRTTVLVMGGRDPWVQFIDTDTDCLVMNQFTPDVPGTISDHINMAKQMAQEIERNIQ